MAFFLGLLDLRIAHPMPSHFPPFFQRPRLVMDQISARGTQTPCRRNGSRLGDVSSAGIGSKHLLARPGRRLRALVGDLETDVRGGAVQAC
jgi:hypothetical protein